MNIFRLEGDLSHLLAIIILLLKMWKTRSCAGISRRSQILFTLVYTTRYLDLFSNYISAYNSAMKVYYIGASYVILYLMYIKFKATYDRSHDTFRIEFLIIPAVVLALVVNHDFSPLEVFWTFSIYLESVAILPQLFLILKIGEAETMILCYLFCLGSYRALYIINWVYRYYNEGFYDLIAIIAGVVHTVIYCNFFCLYFTTDLNKFNLKKPCDIESLSSSVCTNKPFKDEVVPDFADHELGLQCQKQDIRMIWIPALGRNINGVFLMIVNDGCKDSQNLIYRNFIRKYKIKGQFGLATQTFMADGTVVEKSTYPRIKQTVLDKLLESIQASHQCSESKYSGIDIESQTAHDLASKDLIKPSSKTDPLIYSIRCTEFNFPHFTLEIHCINETEDFLAELVHNIGIDLKSAAICTQLP